MTRNSFKPLIKAGYLLGAMLGIVIAARAQESLKRAELSGVVTGSPSPNCAPLKHLVKVRAQGKEIHIVFPSNSASIRLDLDQPLDSIKPSKSAQGGVSLTGRVGHTAGCAITKQTTVECDLDFSQAVCRISGQRAAIFIASTQQLLIVRKEESSDSDD